MKYIKIDNISDKLFFEQLEEFLAQERIADDDGINIIFFIMKGIIEEKEKYLEFGYSQNFSIKKIESILYNQILNKKYSLTLNANFKEVITDTLIKIGDYKFGLSIIAFYEMKSRYYKFIKKHYLPLIKKSDIAIELKKEIKEYLQLHRIVRKF